MDNQSQPKPPEYGPIVFPVTPPFPPATPSPKVNFWKVFIGSLIFGMFGGDHFMAGKIKTGILKWLTLGGFGIWYFIDLVQLLRGKFRDASGNEITNPSPKATWAISIGVILITLSNFGDAVNGGKNNRNDKQAAKNIQLEESIRRPYVGRYLAYGSDTFAGQLGLFADGSCKLVFNYKQQEFNGTWQRDAGHITLKFDNSADIELSFGPNGALGFQQNGESVIYSKVQ